MSSRTTERLIKGLMVLTVVAGVYYAHWAYNDCRDGGEPMSVCIHIITNGK